MITKKQILQFLLISIAMLACQPSLLKKQHYNYDEMDSDIVDLHKDVEEFILTVQQNDDPIHIPVSTRIKEIKLLHDEKYLAISLSDVFSWIPFREDNVAQTYIKLKRFIDDDFEDFTIEIRSLDKSIEELIPNYYRGDRSDWDISRLPKPIPRPAPIVRKLSDNIPPSGLYDRNIALWPSHGWYYNDKQDRWMWQRPRIFGTVEDLLPLSFIVPYIIPMLENAGANVFMPRERDIQTNEIIVDNDSLYSAGNLTTYSEDRTDILHKWQDGISPGYAIGSPPYPVNYNPFQSGTYRFTKSDTVSTTQISWTPFFPDSGYYVVYVSYNSSPQNIDDALYTVYHSADSTSFKVNQQIGGNTWIYLGRFKFNKGYNSLSGSVKLSNKSSVAGKFVAADAVKFGGGMGNVLRNGQTSGRPKFVEGARYYLQTAGFPDTLVYNLYEKNDYNDDFTSRGEWANYLNGSPKGPSKNRNSGLGIPIDASLGFHTDGVKKDPVVGTLQIYSVLDFDSIEVFPDSTSRFANRDFSDIMQSQIVNDIRSLFDPNWKRRALWERQLAETQRPNMPATLLELVSHLNYEDMKFALDPRFRFHISRSIYKSFLRFIASQNEKEFVVQPLPVKHFAARFNQHGDILLSWQDVIDPLEESAKAETYKIYTRVNDHGFDNGSPISEKQYILKNPEIGVIYSFKVTALNDGGESFPSEILAICKMDSSAKPVLIINGFDRIAPPAWFEQGDYSGFAYSLDNGVPDKFDYGFTGDQFNFDATDPWHTNFRPGHGASYGDQETKIIAGNTFDFPYLHGKAIKAAGHSFISSSDEAIMDSIFDINNYDIVDLILGEEKETGWQRSEMDSIQGMPFKTFPEKMKRVIRSFLDDGKSLFISGAYVGTDLFENGVAPYPDQTFAQNYLKFNWRSNHAVRSGKIFNPPNAFLKFPDFSFNTDYRDDIYRVEAPDVIGPFAGSSTVLRYSESGADAAIAFAGNYQIVVFGFPFETILGSKIKNKVMSNILDFFQK